MSSLRNAKLWTIPGFDCDTADPSCFIFKAAFSSGSDNVRTAELFFFDLVLSAVNSLRTA